MTKKMYVAPECVAYTLPAGSLCQTNTSITINSTTPVTDSNDIGVSKGFSGGVEDDSSLNLWEEE
ncbi:MAG: hypothetical protein J6129_05495 [Bacteroidaceae bacterium]|nr:hypothetical protein [Bacteroidaceae bacterium]